MNIYKQKIDVKRLDLLIYNIDRFDTNYFKNKKDKFDTTKKGQLSILKDLKNEFGDKEYVIKEAKFKNIGFGRRYFEGSSLQNVKGSFRNYLCQDICVDIDIVNCFPSILNSFCKKEGIVFQDLQDYVDNRQSFCKEYEIDKFDILKMIHTDTPMYKNGKHVRKLKDMNKFIYQRLLPKMLNMVIPTMYEDVRKKKEEEGDTKNVNGSFVSYFLQDIENGILCDIESGLKKRNFNPHAPIFDGTLVYKDDKLNQEVLDEVIGEVNEKFSTDLKLVFKEMNIDFDPSTFEEIPEEVDEENEEDNCQEYNIGKSLVEIIKNRIIKTSEEIFVKTYDNIYTNKIDSFFNIVIQSSDLAFVAGTKKDIKFYPIKSSAVRWPILRTQMKSYIEANFQNDDSIYSKLDLYEDILPFNNGLWNYKERKFMKYEDYKEDIFMTKKLSYNFPERPPKKIFEELYKILHSIFDFDGDMRPLNEFFKFCSRKIAGKVLDKEFMIALGERNSAKGLIVDYFIYTFGFMIGIFAADNLVIKDKPSLESQERQDAWKGVFVGTKLCFSSELTSDGKLKGGEIKKICSGGDILRFRDACGVPKTGRQTGGMVTLANKFNEIDEVDTYNFMLYMPFPCTFKSDLNDGITFIGKAKQADDNCKKWIKNDILNMHAFLYFVLESYSNDTNYPFLKEQAKIYKELNDVNDPYKQFLSSFIFTGLETDVVMNSIIELHNPNNLSKSRINKLLSSKGAIAFRNNSQRGFCNIMLKEN